MTGTGKDAGGKPTFPRPTSGKDAFHSVPILNLMKTHFLLGFLIGAAINLAFQWTDTAAHLMLYNGGAKDLADRSCYREAPGFQSGSSAPASALAARARMKRRAERPLR